MSITSFLEYIDNLVWNVPLIVLILGTGILLTCRLKVIQMRRLILAAKYMFSNEEGAAGEISSFGAFCTAMAATIGTGNIVGVATAILAGGPGALFWMVVAAFFGMATKYSEGVLAIKYRKIDANGATLGGPFYYIEGGLGQKWKWLAKMFALFGMTASIGGTGTFTQVNGIATAVKGFVDPHDQYLVNLFGTEVSLAIVGTAIVIAFLVALVVLGGIKRIATVTSIIVPFMAVAYFFICLAIIIYNIDKLPAALKHIVESAFGIRAMTGGALGAMLVAMQKGISRGIFSNEAGLGTAPIAAASAQTHTAVRQGLISMTGTFIDTIIVCTMTGTTLIITGATERGLEGANVTGFAFGEGLPWSHSVGAFVLMLALSFFAFTTIIGWDFYGEKCLQYLSGNNMKAVKVYRWLYVLAVLIGPFFTISAVWTIADICNGLMAIPNLIGILFLSGVVVKETKDYFNSDRYRLSVQKHKK